jgi:hypothetical protein
VRPEAASVPPQTRWDKKRAQRPKLRACNSPPQGRRCSRCRRRDQEFGSASPRCLRRGDTTQPRSHCQLRRSGWHPPKPLPCPAKQGHRSERMRLFAATRALIARTRRAWTSPVRSAYSSRGAGAIQHVAFHSHATKPNAGKRSCRISWRAMAGPDLTGDQRMTRAIIRRPRDRGLRGRAIVGNWALRVIAVDIITCQQSGQLRTRHENRRSRLILAV